MVKSAFLDQESMKSFLSIWAGASFTNRDTFPYPKFNISLGTDVKFRVGKSGYITT